MDVTFAYTGLFGWPEVTEKLRMRFPTCRPAAMSAGLPDSTTLVAVKVVEPALV
jgi:hypothetical protein